MNHRLLAAVLVSLFACTSPALDLVTDAKPRAAIVITPDAQPAPARAARNQPKRITAPGDAMAAQVLAEWIKKITGAELPIVTAAPKDTTIIYVGAAAIQAGLKLDAIDSPTHEGLRIVCDGQRLLLAGQDGPATVKAACRLLEELGCRYLMDSPLGEVYPRSATLAVKEMDISAKPGLDVREIWGSSWSGNTLWKIWNGAGGARYPQGHAWGNYVSKDLFDTHPEYFALRNGQRKKGDWYCTSNPELRKIFADGVMAVLERNGRGGASISPPDGTGYCECEQCRAQDNPKSIEPSSGRVAVTDRYVDFFNDVAHRVAEKYPNAKLSFYCYADYTQAPTRGLKLARNLVAWIAPLRYCRLHAIGNPVCPSRVQLQEMIDDWSKATSHIAYRTYNYNLAECLVPFPMLSVWRHDIPYLKQRGAIGINLESLASWQIYGPHLYTSLRLAYDPAADGDALFDDYAKQFYGPASAPMKQYWLDLDNAFASLHAHAGSFYAIHKVYTPEFLSHCRSLIDQATAAAKDDPVYAARVAMHAEGFRNAEQYIQIRDALNVGQPAQALVIYNDLLARTQAQTESRYGNHYTTDYLKRFLGKDVQAAASAAAAPNHLVQVLPDKWRMTYDKQDKGIETGYAKPDFDDAKWQPVVTFSDTLDGQGLPDRKTILWYRTTIDVPEMKGKSALFFIDVDGAATVFINGQQAGVSGKKRTPFAIDAPLHPGRNTIAVRVDHSAISELFLGGIIRPIYLIERRE
ncbi:MAG: hypothetical protein JWN40_1176 [Phycisphaerales bacterium]|nr:hypothetical protein [Phycisphaerales bacterium]